MAINRLFQTGAESGSLNEFDIIFGSMAVSGTAKTGSYSYNHANGTQRYLARTIPATRQIRGGFFVQGTGALDSVVQFTIRDESTNELIGILFGVTQTLYLRVAESTQDTKVGAAPSSGWHHIGYDVYIHSTSGWAKVYRDGVEIMAFSGNTGNVDISTVRFGVVGLSSGGVMYYDDIYIDDTTGEGSAAVCPILTFPYLVPNGAGNYTQWDPSAGNNWDTVEEVPPSDADYVDTNVVDEFDSYTMSTYTLGTGEAFEALIPIARIQRGETTEQIALGTRYSSTDLIGSDQDPGTSFGYLWERQTTKPGGGAWDQTSVDGVEFVQKSRGTY